MNLYIQQKIFTWGDKFSIYDANGNEEYYVEGEILTFGKKCTICRATSLPAWNSSCSRFCRGICMEAQRNG